ncbi:ubiquitin-like autophagy protein Apg12-domain-containing protein [Lipomyces starkeyi]
MDLSHNPSQRTRDVVSKRNMRTPTPSSAIARPSSAVRPGQGDYDDDDNDTRTSESRIVAPSGRPDIEHRHSSARSPTSSLSSSATSSVANYLRRGPLTRGHAERTREQSAEPEQDEQDNAQETIPEEAAPEEKVTMAASVVLTFLPTDATGALEVYARPATHKVGIKFRAIGSAPILSHPVARITASQRFEVVVRFLRRQLKCKDTDPLFVYVNSTFAPALDQEVGYLHDCFKIDGHLHVSYCNTAAFG